MSATAAHHRQRLLLAMQHFDPVFSDSEALQVKRLAALAQSSSVSAKSQQQATTSGGLEALVAASAGNDSQDHNIAAAASASAALSSSSLLVGTNENSSSDMQRALVRKASVYRMHAEYKHVLFVYPKSLK